jgi:hypothetical protein
MNVTVELDPIEAWELCITAACGSRYWAEVWLLPHSKRLWVKERDSGASFVVSADDMGRGMGIGLTRHAAVCSQVGKYRGNVAAFDNVAAEAVLQYACFGDIRYA